MSVDLHPTKCNLCGGKVIFTSNARIYGKEYGSGKCYLCTSCGAYVGTHIPRPDEAMGILADAEMREMKKECHEKFDKLWKWASTGKERHILRRRAYRILAEAMNIPVEQCHFGYFDMEQLKVAYKAVDGIKVNRNLAEDWRKGMKYIASWSGGKDSTATIILAHEHNEPLDLIIFSEVMFDENISGELPEHMEFVHRCIPVFESWGYEVKILHSSLTYMDIFMREPTRGKRFGLGLRTGFPMSGKCQINRSVKVQPIRDFCKTFDCEYMKYIGIAVDEPVRLNRVVKTDNQTSLLQKYGYTERMAFEKCKEYDLLSPIYDFAPRGGCWFCPNARDAELRHLRKCHPDLWKRLLDLEDEPNLIGDKWNILTNTSIHDLEERFMWEDRQMSIFDYLN